VVVVEARAVALEYSAPGEVVARDLRSLSFATGGRVTLVLVDEGASVEEGQELARLESVQQNQNLKAAEAGVARAEADAAKALDDHARVEALFKTGSATRVQLDDATTARNTTEALAVKARAEREAAEEALKDTILFAPAAGIVTARHIDVGLVIGAARPAFEIAAGPAFDATFDLAEVVLTQGRGAPPPVALTPIEGGETVKGRVREISPVVDAARGTVSVKVAIEGTPPGLSLGAPVRGSVMIEEPERIRLPGFALLSTAAGPAVWVRDPTSGSVDLRMVTIGEHETGDVVIASGLTPGEQVVTRGGHLLYRGRLTVVAAEAEANP
jgi:RND family efflux transporter MFP subunit